MVSESRSIESVAGEVSKPHKTSRKRAGARPVDGATAPLRSTGR